MLGSSTSDKRIMRAIELLTHNSSTVSDVAVDVNLSSSRFRHLFKKELNVSPTRYLKTSRLLRAKILVEGSFLRIKEIAALLGVNDVSHFVRDYKAYYGQTPSQTRKSLYQGGQHLRAAEANK
jgi:AraC family transcriptional regulator of arabinose operon